MAPLRGTGALAGLGSQAPGVHALGGPPPPLPPHCPAASGSESLSLFRVWSLRPAGCHLFGTLRGAWLLFSLFKPEPSGRMGL